MFCELQETNGVRNKLECVSNAKSPPAVLQLGVLGVRWDCSLFGVQPSTGGDAPKVVFKQKAFCSKCKPQEGGGGGQQNLFSCFKCSLNLTITFTPNGFFTNMIDDIKDSFFFTTVVG